MFRASSSRFAASLGLVLSTACISGVPGPTASEVVVYANSSSSSSASTASTSASSSSGTASTASSSSAASTSSGTVGSSSSSGAASSSSSGSSGVWVVAAHQPFPQVPNNDPTGASGVLTHPNVVAITYDGYSQQTQIEGFLSWILSSDWLTLVGSSYGVSDGALAATYHLPGPAPFNITDGEIQTQIIELINAGRVPAPLAAGTAADGGIDYALYAIFFPESTTISGSDGTSCVEYGGYHGEIDYNSMRFAYAVLPTCSSGTLENTLDYTEVAMSHELIEAATDPYPDTGPTYVIEDFSSPWQFVPGEIGDLCVGNDTAYDGNAVQRIWSNWAAADGGDPCIPAPANDVFFDVTLTPTTVVGASPGSTVTWQFQAWSTGPVPTADGTWTLYAETGYASFNANPTLSTMNVKNGDTGTLTMTIPSDAIPNQDYASVTILSSDNNFGSYNMWPAAVFVQ